ncbi:hypothetical protein JZ751_023443 [Albula glossodonta]|uniref:Uncharacterized protein n=1 Tax=Albula glossodonta TaxID=121402 RepID=A0A8T2NPL6_9TELE|nr:hypothetical protein JZ751_023443 [Albula glossodonta]
MALVTLQRSPTPSAASTASTTTTNAGEDFGSDDERRLNQRKLIQTLAREAASCPSVLRTMGEESGKRSPLDPPEKGVWTAWEGEQEGEGEAGPC